MTRSNVTTRSNTTRTCGTMPVHRRLLNREPIYLENRASIESLAHSYKRRRDWRRASVTTIPVVVHVVHHTDEENISDEQVLSQIAALTRDFRMRNADASSLPDVWRDLAEDAGVEFVLTNQDADGRPSEGIVRLRTHIAGFIDDDVVKYKARGGLDAWPADRFLNIWVCPMLDLLGYAQFPGGPPQTDGVVIDYRSFGTVGSASAPYHLGRTTTHEVGHWLNLWHIWGDDGMGCTGTDFVDDTPNQSGPNGGNPAFPTISCDNGPDGDLFVNYMDYTDDEAMVMFTTGQVVRMHAALAGPRATFEAGGQQPVEPQPQGPEPAGGGGGWQHTDLTSAADAPDAAGDPIFVVDAAGGARVIYRGLDEHIHELRRAQAGGENAASSPNARNDM